MSIFSGPPSDSWFNGNINDLATDQVLQKDPARFAQKTSGVLRGLFQRIQALEKEISELKKK